MPTISIRGVVTRVAALRQFAATMLPTGLALALQFVVFAITARGLGIVQFGEYSALLAIAAICVELVGVGGGDLLVRAVARNPARHAAFFGNLLILALLTFPIAVLIGGAFALGPMESPIRPAYVFVALLGEILSARVSASVEMVMVGHGHTTGAGFVRLSSAVARLIAAVIYFHIAKNLDGWIIAVLIQSVILSAGLIGVTLAKYGRPQWAVQRAELGAGASFALNQTARATQGNVDRIILARFADSSVLGAYAAGSRLLVIGLFPLQVMTRLFYPHFFRHGEHGLAATRIYARKCILPMLAASILATGSVVVVAQLMPALLGAEFTASRHAAMLLALALPLIGMQYLAADTLTGAGLQHIRAVIYGCSAIGFGFALAAGAKLGGVIGLIAAFLFAHALLMIILWGVALAYPERKVAVA